MSGGRGLLRFCLTSSDNCIRVDLEYHGGASDQDAWSTGAYQTCYTRWRPRFDRTTTYTRIIARLDSIQGSFIDWAHATDLFRPLEACG